MPAGRNFVHVRCGILLSAQLSSLSDMNKILARGSENGSESYTVRIRNFMNVGLYAARHLSLSFVESSIFILFIIFIYLLLLFNIIYYFLSIYFLFPINFYFIYTQYCYFHLDSVNLSIGRDSVIRRLRKRGVEARSAARKEFLTEAHKAKRLQFAMNYGDEPPEFWDNVVFTDAKNFG